MFVGKIYRKVNDVVHEEFGSGGEGGDGKFVCAGKVVEVFTVQRKICDGNSAGFHDAQLKQKNMAMKEESDEKLVPSGIKSPGFVLNN